MIVTEMKTYNNKIANCAFICAVMVVSIHIGLTDTAFAFGWWLKECVAEGLSRVAVPYFFVISGYLIARKYECTDNIWRIGYQESKKRILTLAVPFWIWGVLYSIVLTGFLLLSDVFADRPLRGVQFCDLIMRTSGIDLVHNPVLEPLWYVRVLFLLVIVSPLIIVTVRKLGIGWVIIAYIVYCYLEIEHISLPSVIYDGKGLAFFSIGVYLSVWKDGIAIFYKRHSFLLCVIGIVSVFVMVLVKLSDVRMVIIPFVIPGMLALMWRFVPDANWPRWITSLSFPIYVLHCFMLLPVQYAWHLTAWMDKGVEFFFRWVAVVVGSMAVAILLRRYVPKFYKISFGAR